jgi:DTW domain-containing protein YfiP
MDVKYYTTVFYKAFWSSNLSPDEKFLNGLRKYKSGGARSGMCGECCRTSHFCFCNQNAVWAEVCDSAHHAEASIHQLIVLVSFV